MSVQGEADGKTTYDFIVQTTTFAAGSAVSLHVKFCGVKNGQRVNLWKEFPTPSTISTTPGAGGDLQYSVVPGTGVTLQAYYAFGLLAV